MLKKSFIICEEQTEDIPEIRNVNRQAFKQSQEADLVDKLRQNCHDLVSLTAVFYGKVVGHILFSPVHIQDSGRKIN